MPTAELCLGTHNSGVELPERHWYEPICEFSSDDDCTAEDELLPQVRACNILSSSYHHRILLSPLLSRK